MPLSVPSLSSDATSVHEIDPISPLQSVSCEVVKVRKGEELDDEGFDQGCFILQSEPWSLIMDGRYYLRATWCVRGESGRGRVTSRDSESCKFSKIKGNPRKVDSTLLLTICSKRLSRYDTDLISSRNEKPKRWESFKPSRTSRGFCEKRRRTRVDDLFALPWRLFFGRHYQATFDCDARKEIGSNPLTTDGQLRRPRVEKLRFRFSFLSQALMGYSCEMVPNATRRKLCNSHATRGKHSGVGEVSQERQLWSLRHFSLFQQSTTIDSYSWTKQMPNHQKKIGSSVELFLVTR